MGKLTKKHNINKKQELEQLEEEHCEINKKENELHEKQAELFYKISNKKLELILEQEWMKQQKWKLSINDERYSLCGGKAVSDELCSMFTFGRYGHDEIVIGEYNKKLCLYDNWLTIRCDDGDITLVVSGPDNLVRVIKLFDIKVDTEEVLESFENKKHYAKMELEKIERLGQEIKEVCKKL